MKMYWIIPIAVLALAAAGYLFIPHPADNARTVAQNAKVSAKNDVPAAKAEYRRISQDEAKRMMGLKDGHIIVDVRRGEEYAEGHIPGAVLIPNESIGSAKPALLPDYNQIILVYCRSGRRSKQAAEKLVAMGYTRVYDFGGILDWTGETVTDEDKDD